MLNFFYKGRMIMADTAQKNMNNATKVMTAATQALINFMNSIAKILEDRGRYAPQREMARWIKNGGGILDYKIQGRGISGMLENELKKAEIIYFKTSDGNLVIRNCDLEKINDINRKCLVARSNYYQEVGLDEFENAIADSDIENKELFKVQGLSYVEMECLKRKCNDISRGFMVGVKKNEETGQYDVAVYGKKVCEYNPERTDFCEAGLAYAFSLYGPNQETKMQQILDDAEMDKTIAGLRDKEGMHYLVSDIDPSKYVMFSKDTSTGALEFEYCERRKNKEGKWETEIKQRLDTNDKDFDVELIRCTDQIKNKVLLDNDTDFTAFLNNSLEKTTDRLNKTKEQRAISNAESKFADKINVMIKNRHFKDSGNDELTSEQKFNLYRKEVKTIVENMKSGTTPFGYEEADMNELKDIFKDAGVDIRDYDQAISAFTDMNIETYIPEKKTREEVDKSAKRMDEFIRKDNLETSSRDER